LPTGAPIASATFCIQAGTTGSWTVSKWEFAITARRKGFGIPFLFVFPSAASENIVSISGSNWSAGRISHRKTSSSSPAFHQVCATPGATPST
jgi:hypothetical protein